MRIAFDTLYENPEAPSGAISFYILLLSKLEKNLEHDDVLYIICSQKSQNLFNPQSKKVRKLVFKHSNENVLLRIITQQFILPLKLRKYNIDIYHSGNICPLLLSSSIVASILTMHAFTNPSSMSLAKLIYRKIFGRLTAYKAKLLIANSESNKSDILKFLRISHQKVVLIHEFIDQTTFNLNYSDTEKLRLSAWNIRIPYILFISSLYRYKNLETVIKGFSEVYSRIGSYHFYIAGSTNDTGYLNSLKELVKNSGISPRTTFLGRVNQQEAAILYRNAAVFICLSYYETFGKIYLEAMACGCPVIGSNISSIPEVTGQAAILIDPNDIDGLKVAICKIISDRNFRKNQIDLGFKQSSNFFVEETAKKTYECYRSLIN